MKVIIRRRALNAILKVSEYIESVNTKGSGIIWAQKLYTTLQSLAKDNVSYGLCKSPLLAKYNYSCYAYNNWIIAFRITNNQLEVCRFIWGAKLNY